MGAFDEVNSYYEFKMSGGGEPSRGGGNRGGGNRGGCLSGCVTLVVACLAFAAVVVFAVMYTV